MKVITVSSPKMYRSQTVKFSAREENILKRADVRRATKAAVQQWSSIKRDSTAFALKLERVRGVMVKGNSPKSLFSKWLKSVGIPRATAYWHLSKGKTTSHPQPTVKQLLAKRDKIQSKLAKTSKKAEREEMKTSIKSLDKRVSDKQDILKRQIKAAFKEVRDKVSNVSWFSEHTDEQAPLLKTVVEETQSMVENLKALNLDWKQSGDLLMKVLSAISTGRDPFDAVRPLMTKKKPVASVREEHRQQAQVS